MSTQDEYTQACKELGEQLGERVFVADPLWETFGFRGKAASGRFLYKPSVEYVRADLYDALRPVPVDQVPEAWKDGRRLLGWLIDFEGDWQWHEVHFKDGELVWLSVPTFAATDTLFEYVSLPLSPDTPERGEGGAG